MGTDEDVCFSCFSHNNAKGLPATNTQRQPFEGARVVLPPWPLALSVSCNRIHHKRVTVCHTQGLRGRHCCSVHWHSCCEVGSCGRARRNGCQDLRRCWRWLAGLAGCQPEAARFADCVSEGEAHGRCEGCCQVGDLWGNAVSRAYTPAGRHEGGPGPGIARSAQPLDDNRRTGSHLSRQGLSGNRLRT